MPGDLFHEIAMPDDPGLDKFDCGRDTVNGYFTSRAWFNERKGKASPPTYVFRTEEGGEVVGYVAMGFKNVEHPNDESDSKERYLVIYMFGVNKKFIGKKNHRNQSTSYAESIFKVAEGYATEDSNCAGISLWVSLDNKRAVNFYKKMGLAEDPGGSIPRGEKGAPILTMRKLLCT